MAGKEDQVAAPQVARIDVGFGAERRKLKIAVARQLDAGGAPCALDRPRTVDALCGASAPHISGADQRLGTRGQIGRASCRERVCQYVYISVGAVSLKKKTPNYKPNKKTQNT